MNKYVSIVIVILVIIIGAWLIIRNNKSPASSTDDLGLQAQTQNQVPPQTQNPTDNPTNINNDNNPTTNTMTTATINTNKGSITIEFYEKDAPNTVANFLKLAKSGFYDGTKFHRVIKGFMIQGGDPNSKNDANTSSWGMGGPGYSFADEIDPSSALYQTGYKKGIVAMANSGPNTNGSQFFIMTADYPLPPSYTIFGKVDSGQDVVDAIANVQTGANDRPVDPVIISSVTVK